MRRVTVSYGIRPMPEWWLRVPVLEGVGVFGRRELDGDRWLVEAHIPHDAPAIEVVTGSGRVVRTYQPGCDVVEEIRSRAVLRCRPARPRVEQLELGLG